MVERIETSITRPAGLITWRAGWGGSRTSGSGSGLRKRVGRETETAPQTDFHTKLRGPTRGLYYHLYVLIDIYSRFNPGWIVSTVEESPLAADFLADAIARNGAAPHTEHADRGTPMTSKPVSALLTDLGVTRTHSRPRMSNDNPYDSESQTEP